MAENAKKNREMSVTEVSELLLVTARQVRNWIKEKGLPARSSERGKILNWPDALEWYVTHRTQLGGNGGSRSSLAGSDDLGEEVESYEAALARKTRAEADIKELILARERSEVVSIGDVEKAVTRSNKSIQTLIQAFPASLAPQLVSIDDRARIFAMLQRECNELLTNLTRIEAVVERRDGPDSDQDDEEV